MKQLFYKIVINFSIVGFILLMLFVGIVSQFNLDPKYYIGPLILAVLIVVSLFITLLVYLITDYKKIRWEYRIALIVFFVVIIVSVTQGLYRRSLIEPFFEISLKDSGGKVMGVAMFEGKKESTNISIDLFNAPMIFRSAYIKKGTCTQLGETVYDLKNIYDGVSTVNLQIPIKQLLSQLPLSLAIYETGDIKNLVTCGEIKEK